MVVSSFVLRPFTGFDVTGFWNAGSGLGISDTSSQIGVHALARTSDAGMWRMYRYSIPKRDSAETRATLLRNKKPRIRRGGGGCGSRL